MFRRFATLAAVVIVASTGITACSKSGGSTSTPFSTTAEKLVDDLGAGNYAAVEVRFTPDLVLHLPPDKLLQDWNSFQDSLGTYKSHGAAKGSTQNGQTIVNVPVKMGTRKGVVQITYRPDTAVVGLGFLTPK